MRIERSKEWWLRFIADEPDCPISAGVPDPAPRKAGRVGMILLGIRAKFAHLWRLGIIKRTTAFRWEMDRALGGWS